MMPKDFWITNVVAEEGSDEELAIPRSEKRSILKIEGRTRQGTDRVNERFAVLVAALEDGMDGLEMKSRMDPQGSRFVIELSTLAPGSEGIPAPLGEDVDSEITSEEDAE
jgi:hypothetical protein